MIEKKEKKIHSNKPLILLFLIILCACFIRIAVFNHVYFETPASIQQSDTPRYEDPALQLLKYGTLAIEPDIPKTTTLSTTPLYSLFIAGTYKVFGGKDQYALMLLQILLSMLTIVLVYFLAVKLWNAKVALMAATFMTIAPLQILYSQVILSETLFTLFFISSLLAVTNLITLPQKYLWAFSFGTLITLATLTRPISYYLVFCIILGLAIFRSKVTKTWSQFIVVTVLILIPFLSVTSAWKSRNENLTGVYALNNAMSETMLYWKAKGVLMLERSISKEEAQEEIDQRLPPNLNNPKEQADAETKLAKEIILGDLNNYLKLTMTGIKSIVLGPGLSSQGSYYDPVNSGRYIEETYQKNTTLVNKLEKKTGYQLWYLILIAYSVTLLLLSYFLATYGFYKTMRKSSPINVIVHLLMLGVVIYIILISTGHIAADSRMRFPITPIFLLYAAYGLSELLQKKEQKIIS